METNPTAHIDQPAGASAQYSRDAIVFVPAIGGAWDDPSIEGIARRIANVVDTGSKNVKAKAKVKVQDQTYGEQAEFKTRVCTIYKTDAGQDIPILDVYGMDYGDTLTSQYQNRSLLYKSIFVAFMIVRTSPLVVAQFWRDGKSLIEKVQLVYGALILSLLVAYMVSLGYAAYSSYKLLRPTRATEATEATSRGSNPPARQEAGAGSVQENSTAASKVVGFFKDAGKNLSSKISVLFPVLIVGFTAVGVASPKASRITDLMSRAATYCLCLISYLTSGERSNAIRGKLDRLIEYIAEKEELGYRNIHIIGYSFGSILALDALFPATHSPGPRFDKIHTLVTIGSPYDIVRNYFPDYFENREARPSAPQRWLNVYTPVDVLSSNFADVGGIQVATETVHLKAGSKRKLELPTNILYGVGSSYPKEMLSLWDVIMLTGFRSHSIYWGATYEAEITCFHHIIPEIYGHDAILDYVEGVNPST
jgi:pimeloyl-ACP methyl ester carboxylesterase